jgi:tetratricopeptide (TPR) repeat protein
MKMGVFDKIGETVVNLFSGKKGIILILLVIIVSAGVWKYQFSGAQEEVVEEEEAYWSYIEMSDELRFRAMELSENADAAMDKKDFDKAIEIYTKQIELTKEARNLVLKAYDSTDDELLKEYVRYGAEQLRYVILWEEARIKGVKSLKEGDLESAEKYLEEFDAYQKKTREMDEKIKEVKKILEEAGKWK